MGPSFNDVNASTMAPNNVSNDQQQLVDEFVELVSKARARRRAAQQALGETPSQADLPPVTKAQAFKFLQARKFDLSRAVSLFEQHEVTREREGLNLLDPGTEPLKSELNTGKFTILPTRDASGAAIAVFTARIHCPQTSTHQITLQGLVYQLDCALESVDTQKAGLVFIYDMSDSKYSHFDYDLSQKILTLLKGGYPAKLKKVLIVTAPLWFKAPFKILRLFVREKLRDRVYTVSIPQLSLHIPRECLPVGLGGVLQITHNAWLLHCQKSMANKVSELNTNNITKTNSYLGTRYGCYVHRMDIYIGKKRGAGGLLVSRTLKTDESPGISEDEEINSHNHETWQPTTESAASPVAGSSASSGFSDDDSLHDSGSGGLTLVEFVESVRSKGRAGLSAEYAELKARPPDGTFTHARLKANVAKNRYTDVLCYDHSRVLLSQQGEDSTSDYINANFVDGYKQKNAFISTQGPLPRTCEDFWRMVWEQGSVVVVMTTRVMERGRTKCCQYWPVETETSASYGTFTVANNNMEENQDYVVSYLTLTNDKTEERREIEHYQYTSWPDYGVPESATGMLLFLERVRTAQARLLSALGDTWAGHPRGPPIVVHCSAGIGRTGTFCTMDICISRLEETGSVDVRGTVERIRSQRAFSIQMPDQYVFCHLALIEYAISKGMIPTPDLASFHHIAPDDSE